MMYVCHSEIEDHALTLYLLDSETTSSPRFHKMAGISWKISTLNSEVEEEKTESSTLYDV